MKACPEESLKHTKKVNPQISFPVNTKRIFADYRHKLVVPSPDTYYKHEDGRRSIPGKEYGIAYHAEKDSTHINNSQGVKIAQSPRFN